MLARLVARTFLRASKNVFGRQKQIETESGSIHNLNNINKKYITPKNNNKKILKKKTGHEPSIKNLKVKTLKIKKHKKKKLS